VIDTDLQEARMKFRFAASYFGIAVFLSFHSVPSEGVLSGREPNRDGP
jgi:hypothetical protein